jgi:two-component system LytT family response regulator
MRALIVDDERLARQKVRMLLQRHADVEVVAECADGQEAVRALRGGDLDVVFLDIRMPGLSGLDALRAVPGPRVPVVVFVTAHADHALEAFDAEAVDYLLKPFDRGRFDTALERIRRRLQRPESLQAALEQVVRRLSALEGRLGSEAPPPTDRLALRLDGRTLLLGVAEVEWIAAEGKYVRVHVRGASHLVRETLKGLEARLDGARFPRIHRGIIVNRDRVREVHPGVGEEKVVVLADGTQLPLSRRHHARLRARGVKW